MRHRLAASALVVASCIGGLSLARDFPGIEALMSPEEYRAAGLHKLSDAEREALDAWLVRYTAGEAETLRNTSEEVREAEKEARVEARVQAPFEGWSGDTVFQLDNGQVWRQRTDGRFSYEGDDRDVVIDKNFFGFWRLTHVASGRRVGVTRVR